MRSAAAIALFLALTLAGWPQASDPVADRMQRKLDHLQRNAQRKQPGPKPTVLTEEEVNAYFAAGRVQLPQGVRSARFRGRPDTVTADAQVDFDELRRGRPSANPLLAIFTGVHDVQVVARASGSGGQALVEVESVALDGVVIPRRIVQLFVERYITRRWPHLGMESRFQLPARIDSAVVGPAQVTLSQK